MSLISYLLYLYVFLKPFYLFKSGGLQISDVVLIIAFFLFLMLTTKNKKDFIIEIKENKEYVIFTICTLCVNLIYFIIYVKFKFILSSLYYIFDAMAIILFAYCFKKKGTFLINVQKIFKLNLIVQLVIYFLHVGRYYDATRYMGTFNDPNQFAYFVLLSFSFIYLIDLAIMKNKESHTFIYFIISLFLVYCSTSTGMLMGFVVFILFYIFYAIRNFKSIIEKNKVKLFVLSFFILILGIVIIIEKPSFININLNDSAIFNRVIDKFNRISSENTNSNSWTVWQERGYDKMWIYPQYILYGAGEGEYTRFSLSAHANEFHATLPSILFYYGIIPFIIILTWFYKKLRKVPLSLLIVYLSLLVESFTLLNQRQALFWIIFMMAPHFSKCYFEKDELIEEKKEFNKQ